MLLGTQPSDGNGRGIADSYRRSERTDQAYATVCSVVNPRKRSSPTRHNWPYSTSQKANQWLPSAMPMSKSLLQFRAVASASHCRQICRVSRSSTNRVARPGCVTVLPLLICAYQPDSTPNTAPPAAQCLSPQPPRGGGATSHTRSTCPAHAQRIIGITDAGNRGLIALQACQVYVRKLRQLDLG